MSLFDVEFEHGERKYRCVGKADHSSGHAEATVYTMFCDGFECDDHVIDATMRSEEFYKSLEGAIELYRKERIESDAHDGDTFSFRP